MIVRRLSALLAAVALGPIATGCAAAGAGGGDTAPTAVASYYPLAFVAERVGGADIRVENLTSSGVEPHDLELTARQVGEIAAADVVVYESGFQPSVDEAVEQNASGTLVDVADVVPLRQHNGASDPHVWLDPSRLSAIAEAVANALADAAPDNAETITRRAEALQAELATLDEEYRLGLTECERTVVVTSHDAFGYLADRYGLTMVGISGLAPDAEPSPARLRDVQQVIVEHGVTTVFYERLVSPDVAQSMADDLGVATAVLDPIEGLTEDTEGADYLTLMRANLEALEEANGCT
jgi:zinc transport system substrate-binding protein